MPLWPRLQRHFACDRRVEHLVEEGKLRHDGHPVLDMAAANAKVEMDFVTCLTHRLCVHVVLYRALSLFSNDISPEALAWDKKTSKIVTVIGIPSAFLLHGYVGFIFGSIKANPWWGSVLDADGFPSLGGGFGHRLGVLVYMVLNVRRREKD